MKKIQSGKNDEAVVKFSFTWNSKDNEIHEGKLQEIPWRDFCLLLQDGHECVNKKNDARLIIPADFIGLCITPRGKTSLSYEKYEPAIYSQKSNRDGEIKTRDDGKPQIRRCAANIRDIYMLILDIDGLSTIEEAKERFERWEYLIYTSSGHRTKRKKYKDAFRLIFPLLHRISREDYEARGKSILDWAGGIADNTSTDISRGFFAPSYEAQDAHRGHFIERHEGSLLDLRGLDAEPKKVVVAHTLIKKEQHVVSKNNPKLATLFGSMTKTTKNRITPDGLVDLFYDLGLYVGATSASGETYSNTHMVKCPFHHWGKNVHSDNNDTGTAIFTNEYGVAGFRCAHNACVDNKMKQLYHLVVGEKGIDYWNRFCDGQMHYKRSARSELQETKRLALDILKKRG